MTLNKEDIKLLRKTNDIIDRLGWENLIWRVLFFAALGYIVSGWLK